MANVRRALLSVSDKSGIVELARALSALAIELVSTGGTAQLLAREGIAVTEVETSSMASALRARASSTMPDLSEDRKSVV